MSINSLEFAKKFTGVLDKILTEKSKTGFMEDNVFKQKFVGAKTVLIPQIDMSALADYDRDTGFTRGPISVSNTSYELTQDRGRSFSIDREDLDETGVAELAGRFLSEFVRTKVVPEIDSYNLSKLSGIAISKSHTLSLTDYPLATKAFAAFTKLEENIRNAGIGEDEELVCFVPWDVYSTFINSSEISKRINVESFKQGEIDLKVKKINDISIIPVSKEKMFTAYKSLDGKSTGQEKGGLIPAENAKKISMLMLPKSAASLVKKSEKIRTFSPEQNQQAVAWRFDYRIYYDIFVKNSMINSIWVLKEADTTPAQQGTTQQGE